MEGFLLKPAPCAHAPARTRPARCARRRAQRCRRACPNPTDVHIRVRACSNQACTLRSAAGTALRRRERAGGLQRAQEVGERLLLARARAALGQAAQLQRALRRLARQRLQAGACAAHTLLFLF